MDDEVVELRVYVDEEMRKEIGGEDGDREYGEKDNGRFRGEGKGGRGGGGNKRRGIGRSEFVEGGIRGVIKGGGGRVERVKEIGGGIKNEAKLSRRMKNGV